MNKKDLLHRAIHAATPGRQDKEAKANERIIQRIRNFFDAPTPEFQRTLEIIFQIIRATKLETNGHQEQEK